MFKHFKPTTLIRHPELVDRVSLKLQRVAQGSHAVVKEVLWDFSPATAGSK